MSDMKDDIGEVLFSEEKIASIVRNMGRQISEDYVGKNLFMVSVLKGSLVFMADLMRAVTIPCSIDFLSVSSYGNGTASSGEVRILKDLDCSLEGKDLLIVEDILDSGMTLSFSRRCRPGTPRVSACVHSWTNRNAAGLTSVPITWARRFRINS